MRVRSAVGERRLLLREHLLQRRADLGLEVALGHASVVELGPERLEQLLVHDLLHVAERVDVAGRAGVPADGVAVDPVDLGRVDPVPPRGGETVGQAHGVVAFRRRKPPRRSRRSESGTAAGRTGGHVLLGELLDGLAHRVVRLVEHDRHTAVDRRGHGPRRRDLRGDARVERRLHVVQGQADLGVGPVEDHAPLVARVVEQVERLQRQLEVLQGGDVERRHEPEHLARVEGREHVVGERRRRVDDDVVEHAAQDPQHVGDQVGGDALRSPRLERRDQRREPGRVRCEQAGEPGLVERAGERDRVGDGVGREELQGDRDVAEGQVEVDQADLLATVLGQRHGEVRRDRRLPAAALGREDRDDPSAGRVVVALVAALELMADLAPDLVGPSHGVGQRGELAVGDDLAHAGAQGLGEHGGVQPAADQDHAEGGVLPADGARERERRLGVDGDAEHDDVLARVLLEVSAHLVEAGEQRALAADGGGQRVGGLGVVVHDDGHQLLRISWGTDCRR